MDRHGNRGGIWLVAEENEEDAAAAEGMDGTNLLIFRVGPQVYIASGFGVHLGPRLKSDVLG